MPTLSQPIEGVHLYRYRFRSRGLCDLALNQGSNITTDQGLEASDFSEWPVSSRQDKSGDPVFVF